MDNKNAFAQLSKLSAKSFNDQKALIKKVLAGREMPCNSCQQTLTYVLPTKDDATTSIRCNKGCTDILLDFVVE